MQNTELYNLYGIVIDAQSPAAKARCYRQQVKIIDPSLYNESEGTTACISVTFFASLESQLPQFKRVGDIIRIHRANIGQYKNFKTFSVNLAYGSSWCIFSGFDTNPTQKQSPFD